MHRITEPGSAFSAICMATAKVEQPEIPVKMPSFWGIVGLAASSCGAGSAISLTQARYLAYRHISSLSSQHPLPPRIQLLVPSGRLTTDPQREEPQSTTAS